MNLNHLPKATQLMRGLVRIQTYPCQRSSVKTLHCASTIRATQHIRLGLNVSPVVQAGE